MMDEKASFLYSNRLDRCDDFDFYDGTMSHENTQSNTCNQTTLNHHHHHHHHHHEHTRTSSWSQAPSNGFINTHDQNKYKEESILVGQKNTRTNSNVYDSSGPQSHSFLYRHQENNDTTLQNYSGGPNQGWNNSSIIKGFSFEYKEYLSIPSAYSFVSDSSFQASLTSSFKAIVYRTSYYLYHLINRPWYYIEQVYCYWVKPLLLHSSTRRIFYFALLNLTFTLGEILIGWNSGSLSLMSDGFHMLLDSSVVFANLFIMVISTWTPTLKFPFGYGRVEIIASLFNTLLLMLIAISMMFQAFERLYSPIYIDTQPVFYVSVIGLIVNVVGIVSFNGTLHHHHSSCKNSHDHDDNDLEHLSFEKAKCDYNIHSRPASNALFKGMFLHVLADTTGSIMVILSTFLIGYSGWLWIDPLISIILSILIFFASWTLIWDSIEILMNGTPAFLLPLIPSLLNEIRNIPSVDVIEEFYTWQVKTDQLLGVVKVKCHLSENPISTATEQQIRHQIKEILFQRVKFHSLSIEIHSELR